MTASRVYVEGNSELEQLYPERWAAIVHVKMKDGREFSSGTSPRAIPEPMTWESSEQICESSWPIHFRLIKAVVELVSGLETLDDTKS